MKTMTTVLILAGMATLSSIAGEQASPTSEPSTQPVNNQATAPSKPKKQSDIVDKLYFGGAVRLSFGDYTVIGVEPMLGYRINPKLSAGVTARYDYIRDSRDSTTRETSQYGGSIYGRYNVTDLLYAQIEPASYNHELFYFDGSSEREWVPYLFMGGGYRQPLGERSWFYAQIMFDVLQDSDSPYDDWTPFFSLGIGTGL
jgi:hypothetical protein